MNTISYLILAIIIFWVIQRSRLTMYKGAVIRSLVEDFGYDVTDSSRIVNANIRDIKKLRKKNAAPEAIADHIDSKIGHNRNI